jgi:predicted transcriptional regulator
MEFTGKKGSSKQNQIASFLRVVKSTFNTPKLQAKEWAEAFDILKEYIENSSKEGKKVLFIDELPWLDSAKSGFLEELSYFWNNFLSKREDIILVVCGSAASYMLKKVIHNKGPLHGRVTQIISLKTFNLSEVKTFLEEKGCHYSNKSISELFMILGGVAKYIDSITSEFTVTQNIDNLIFSQNALLRNEYKELFTSLFDSAKTHYEIMNTLISKWSGFTQKELSEKIKISQTGVKEPLKELVSSGFVTQIQKFGQTKRDIIYRATDPFSYFYHKWLKELKFTNFNAISISQSYKSWSGFAFENLCHIHIDAIKKALGISGVPTLAHYWSFKGDETLFGAQID